jgi:hypothetical protein
MLRSAILALACCAPLFLGACRDNADPVKPKVAQSAPLPPASA